MSKEFEEKLRNCQENFFGKRYVGATLSEVCFANGSDQSIAEWMKKPKNFLVMFGPSGTGKTYFCSASLEILLKKYNTLRSYNEDNLLKRLRTHISIGSSGDYLEYLQKLIDDEFIIIDDLFSSGPTDWRIGVIKDIVNYRYDKKAPTIFTTNLNRQEIYQNYGQRIETRLFAKENLIIDLSDSENLREKGL